MSRIPIVVLFGILGLMGGLIAFLASGLSILAIPALIISPALAAGVALQYLRKHHSSLLASSADLNRAKIGPPAPPEKPRQLRKRRLKASAMMFLSALVVCGSVFKLGPLNTFGALFVAVSVIGTFVLLTVETVRFIADRVRTT